MSDDRWDAWNDLPRTPETGTGWATNVSGTKVRNALKHAEQVILDAPNLIVYIKAGALVIWVRRT